MIYQARALYSIVYNDLRMWSDLNCGGAAESSGSMATGGSRKITSSDSSTSEILLDNGYILHPNPNKGIFTLTQHDPNAEQVHAEIWNVMGVQVYNQVLTFSNGDAAINMGNMAVGVYMLQITDAAGKQYLLKFVVE